MNPTRSQKRTETILRSSRSERSAATGAPQEGQKGKSPSKSFRRRRTSAPRQSTVDVRHDPSGDRLRRSLRFFRSTTAWRPRSAGAAALLRSGAVTTYAASCASPMGDVHRAPGVLGPRAGSLAAGLVRMGRPSIGRSPTRSCRACGSAAGARSARRGRRSSPNAPTALFVADAGMGLRSSRSSSTGSRVLSRDSERPTVVVPLNRERPERDSRFPAAPSSHSRRKLRQIRSSSVLRP